MESCEYRRDRVHLAVGAGDGWRGRQDSRTLRMRGIWTVGDEGPTASAKTEKETWGCTRFVWRQ